MSTPTVTKHIIIFDGECNLCNGVVGWLFTYAPATLFEFVPFQSPKGQRLLTQFGYATKRLETVMLIEGNTVLTHSDGFLKIMSAIPKWRRIASGLSLIPRLFRDAIYKIAARYRLRWFGKSNSCALSLGV